MYDPDTPYKTQPKKTAHEHEHVHHHLSPWAILTGFTAPLLAIGIVVGGPMLWIGAVLLGVSVAGWFVEDHHEWPKGPNPLTQHTQGVKDNGWWGVVLFLASEVIIFGSLFGVWFTARASSVAKGLDWPPVGTPAELPLFDTGISTAILVASGFVMHWGEGGLKTGNRKRFVGGFVGAIALGLWFMQRQVAEYQHLLHEGFTMDTNIFTTMFYALTGTHGIHVMGGLLFLAIVTIRGALGQFDAKRHTAVTAAAYYWHFVDVVWIFLYVVVYLEWL